MPVITIHKCNRCGAEAPKDESSMYELSLSVVQMRNGWQNTTKLKNDGKILCCSSCATETNLICLIDPSNNAGVEPPRLEDIIYDIACEAVTNNQS